MCKQLVVLEIPGTSPLNQRNKIVAGKSALFEVRKPAGIKNGAGCALLLPVRLGPSGQGRTVGMLITTKDMLMSATGH
jgi:hypothetical protein